MPQMAMIDRRRNSQMTQNRFVEGVAPKVVPQSGDDVG